MVQISETEKYPFSLYRLIAYIRPAQMWQEPLSFIQLGFFYKILITAKCINSNVTKCTFTQTALKKVQKSNKGFIQNNERKGETKEKICGKKRTGNLHTETIRT